MPLAKPAAPQRGVSRMAEESPTRLRGNRNGLAIPSGRAFHRKKLVHVFDAHPRQQSMLLPNPAQELDPAGQFLGGNYRFSRKLENQYPSAGGPCGDINEGQSGAQVRWAGGTYISAVIGGRVVVSQLHFPGSRLWTPI